MATFRQELPPAGGYQPIEWVKQASFKRPNGYKLLAGVLGLKAVGLYWYYLQTLKKRAQELEANDARIALSPLMLAESDRSYLKFARAMREEEEILMKDVPNWKVGMCYDEPVYYHRDEQDLQLISRHEEQVFSEKVTARGVIALSGWRPKLPKFLFGSSKSSE